MCLGAHKNRLIVVTLTFNQISSKFHIWMATIKLSFRYENGFCPMDDNQDGRQNGHRLSVSAVVVTLSHF